jgi:acyl-CoA thioesterase FadM
MAARSRIERPYRVRFDEAGPDGHLRSSGFLRYAQDLAWIHSESAGFGREWYGERRLMWLVRAIELDVLADVQYGSELVVSTELIGFRRVWVRRRSEFHAADSERPAALAVTDWVLLNSRGAPTRVPAEILDVFDEPLPQFTPVRLEQLEPSPDASTHQLQVRRSDLDPMAHVNNAAYLDYLDEHYIANRRARMSMPTPRRYRAEFIASAEPDSDLVGRGWTADATWCYKIEDVSGKEMLRARLETDPASWVGG